MADGTRENPLNVNIVDMLGAASLQQMVSDFETGMSQFRSEVDAIKDGINALNTNVEESVKAQKDLAESFGKFYASGGYSAQSSRQFHQPGGPLLGPDGQPMTAGGTTSPGSRSSHASTPDSSFDPNDFTVRDESLKRAMFDNTRAQFRAGRQSGKGIFESGLDAALKYGRSTGEIDLPESAVNAGAARKGPSAGASSGGGGTLGGGGSGLGGTPMSFMSETPEPLQIPQFGEFQADTLLRFMGGMAQRFTQRRVAQKGGDDTLGKMGGTAALGLYKAAEFAPKAALVQQYARGLGFTADAQALQAQGQMGNAYGTMGQVDPGPLPGFSVPFLNPTYIKGIQEEFQRGKRAFSKPGLNMREAAFVDEQLYKEGFSGDDGGFTNRMREAGDRLMQVNKRAGNNEMNYQILTRAGRTAQGSLSELVEILGEDLPKATKAAKVSQEQLSADILAYAETIENSGGTTIQAAKNVSMMGQIGIPPAVVAKYTQSPFFQSTAFRQTGLMPMTQGAMKEGDVAQSFFSSLNELAQMSEGFSDISRPAAGLPGRFGLKSEYTKYDQQIGMMSQLGDVSAEMLRKIIDPKTGRVRAGFENMLGLMSGMSGLVSQVDPNNKNINYNKILSTTEKYSNDGAWSYGEQIKMLRGSEAFDEDGNFINIGKKYKEDIDKLATLGQEEIQKLQVNGINGGERGQIQKIMQERQNKMQEFISDKGLQAGLPEAETGDKNQVEIVLKGAAKSIFKLNDKREKAKDEGSEINNALGPNSGSLLDSLYREYR